MNHDTVKCDRIGELHTHSLWISIESAPAVCPGDPRGAKCCGGVAAGLGQVPPSPLVVVTGANTLAADQLILQQVHHMIQYKTSISETA